MAEISKTLDQGLILLGALAEGGPGTVADIAERTRLNRTVAHRLIATLEARGYVRRDPAGTVSLGSALLQLGGRVQTDLRAAARIPLRVLAARLKETAVLTIAEGDDAIAIDQCIGGFHLLRIDYRTGYRHALDRAAHGRAILAFRGESTADVNDKELRAIRKRGYATSRDELQTGAAGIASPVFDRDGAVVGSIGVVAPVDRMPAAKQAAPAVIKAAAETTAHLGSNWKSICEGSQ